MSGGYAAKYMVRSEPESRLKYLKYCISDI